ncbi:dihydroorotase [Granulosicoccus antarcticus]|uniref:Dihydroorotase n=1 Tax=Granulosicoccus antarcticus IMCC3135 TaxID=1192854 RepID=A0A2Z2NVZ1_9GAMM|nr:dihydroorotase [Granulosicoccus antarcticus]ASJ71324.1 Dihydroorotase [Granulosicoccus antarcticus IMCC3135]
MSVSSNRVIIRDAQLVGEKHLSTLIVQDGIIESVVPASGAPLESEADSAAMIIDAAGQLAVSGMTDLYARLREPGFTRKGSIAHETKAALSAGFTRVLCAPDTNPAIDNVATVELVRHRAEAGHGAQVLPMAALTMGLQGEQLSELATLQAAGCPVAGQADHPIGSPTVLFSAMEYAASFNMPLFLCARDALLGAGGCAHTGAIATRLGLPGIPVAAETVALAQMLELCRETGCRLHISRISSARAVEMIATAKQQALPVTCDVGLHHLFFIDEHLAGYDSSFHSAVPFRSQNDREALRQGVCNGVIDAICTDHAPHDLDASLAPFPSTEAGLAAYQWAIPLIMQLPEILQLPLKQVFDKLGDAPRRILDGSTSSGLSTGEQADFFLLSPELPIEQNFDKSTLAGMNHPLNTHSADSLGLAQLQGKVTHVLTRNRVHSTHATH